MKFCIHCKFYKESDMGPNYDKCLANGRQVTNLVTGEQSLEYAYCDIQRRLRLNADGGPSCGPDAQFFQPKEEAA